MFGSNSNNDGDDSEENSGVFGGLYSRLGGSDTSEQEPVDPNPAVKRWSLGNHTMMPGINADQFNSEIERVKEVNPGLADVLSEAQEMVADSKVRQWECGVCGLGHNHPDDKHDIRGEYESDDPGFSVAEDFAEEVEFCPYCHCGVNELAMLIDFFCHLPQPMFRDQQKFESVLEVGNDTLIRYCQARRDLSDEKFGAKDVPLEAVVEAEDYEFSGDEANLLAEVGEEKTLFYERWRDIKRGAAGAPIAGETRKAIANLREHVRGQLSLDEGTDDESESDEVADEAEKLAEEMEETEPEHDRDKKGEVGFYNSTRGYGFIESDEVADNVFFHVEDNGNKHLDRLPEGTHVVFNMAHSQRGPRAKNIIVLSDDE